MHQQHNRGGVGWRDQNVLGKSLKHPKSDRYCIWFIQWMYIFLCILCTLLLYMMYACETFLRGCYKITLSINLKLVLRSPQRVTTVCLVSPSRICNQNGHQTCCRHIRAVRVTFGCQNTHISVRHSSYLLCGCELVSETIYFWKPQSKTCKNL